MPFAAAWRANSSPIPKDAPVTSARRQYTCFPGCFMAPTSVRMVTRQVLAQGPARGRLGCRWVRWRARRGCCWRAAR